MTRSPFWELDVAWPAAGGQRIYDLAQPLQPGIPHHPSHPPYAFTLTKQHGEVMYPEGVSASSELLCLGGHVGTHVDGLGHVSKNGRIHGDREIAEGQSYTEGIRHGAIDGAAPFLGPGCLVDVPRLLGRELTPDDSVTAEMFDRWFAERTPPGRGSIVLVRTGWDERWSDVRGYLGDGGRAPGVDLSGARWLTERGIAATGCDTIAYEKFPSPSLVVHVHLLVEHGVHIMEAMNLIELAADEVYEFFFIAVPLRIRGGTGSPIRPLAIVPSGERG
jgi:kynurenine formamidase